MNKFMKTQKQIEKNVVSGYQSMEKAVVGGYKSIENSVVSGYKKIEDKFVKAFLTPDDTDNSVKESCHERRNEK